jgi:TonB-linked SusC/RagA family outer membrane protein
MKKRCTHILFKPISKNPAISSIKNSAAVILLLLVLSVFTLPAWAQNAIKVTGVVKDNKGATLPGVSVKVKGTTLGALTDIDGKFSVTVPNASAVLVFSYVSFTTKEVAVGATRTFDITLVDDNTSLSEVVVLGYGQTSSKRDLAAAMGTVSAKQIAERQPLSLADALEGQIAGTQVVTDGGDPLSQGTIQIRGASSLNSGVGPLYVIDGVLNDDASFLNPQDINSIEVLKDAASAAIYGVRGANGVIIITTKGGKEGKARLSINYYHLFGQLAHKLQTASAKDVTYYRKVLGGGAGASAALNPDSVSTYDNKDNDYQDLLYRTGNKDNINLSVSGGNKNLIYYTSLNYVNDKSIIINSYAHGLTTLFNVDYQATDKFKLSNHINASYVTGNKIDIGNTANQVFQRNPWVSLFRPDGSMAGYVESKRNPVAFAIYGEDVPTTYTVQDNIVGNYNFLKELKLTVSANARLDDQDEQKFTPLSITSGALGPNDGNNIQNRKFTYELQSFLNYNKTFGKDHAVTAVLGYSRDRHSNDGINLHFQNYLSEDIRVSSDASLAPGTPVTTTSTYSSTESVFGRAQYTYQDKYIINGTFRRDGSSRFGPDNKWGNFSAGGIAWRFSSESFMNWSKSWLDDAKLRASIGVLGNDKVSDFGYATLLNFGQGIVSTNSGIYNGNNAAYVSLTLGNPTIHWEQTKTTNIGMDLTMLKGRLTFTPDYFIKETDGLLSQQQLPEETGLKNGAINLGNIRNKGLELTLTGVPISTKNFKWNVSGNVTFQDAPLITYLSPTVTKVNGSYALQTGGRIGDFYLLKNLGVYQYNVSNTYDANWNRLIPVGVNATGTTATGYTNLDGSTYTGSVFNHETRSGKVLIGGSTIWDDLDRNGVIDENDRQVLGNGIPKVYFGLNNYFTYKNFTFNILFNASFGNKVYNSISNSNNTESSNYTPPTVVSIYNSWHKPGDVSIYPDYSSAIKDTYGSIANGENSLYLEDGAFIRLSSFKLSYNLGERLLGKLKARTFNVYVYGNNLVTWTNYSWYDPEFTVSNFLQPGFDSGKYPRRREIGLGLNIGF